MSKQNKNKTNILIKTLKLIITVAICLGLLFALLVAYLSITEYKPDDVTKLKILNNSSEEISKGKEISLMTWNIGYGALGDNADFFMDGGKMVNTATKKRLESNLDNIESFVRDEGSDIQFFQEMDTNSYRSHHTNEYKRMGKVLSSSASALAYNFKVKFIPYPIPPIGKVEGGISTFSGYKINSAERIKLPTPFKWPVRIANLKRCLLVTKLPVADSDKELVLINLHLEAFDDGSGKIEQTKKLKEYMDKEVAKGNYVIAAGDFNQTFSNIDTSMYPVVWDSWVAGLIDHKDIGNDYKMLMDNSAPTCRSNHRVYANRDPKKPYQYFMIDGFIVSNNVKVSDVNTKNLDFKSSDHNPVVLRFSL